MNFTSHRALQHMENDNPELYRAQGGDNRSHIYGECYPEAMWEILEAAVCSVNCATGVPQTLAKYEFFDLGSGYGKFPMYAALVGMKSATGIELDSARHDIAHE